MVGNLGKKLILHLYTGPSPMARRFLSLDLMTVAMGIAVGIILVGLALWLRRGLPRDPGASLSRRAVFVKAMLEFLETQLLGGFRSPELVRSLFPLLSTLFLYVLLSNWLSIVPKAEAPTQNLNVTLGMAVMVYGLSHFYAVRQKGLRRHLRSYLEPYPFLLPMNLIGDFGRTLSHAFRLFGNILGGSILTAVVLDLAGKAFTKLGPYLAPVTFTAGVAAGTILNAWFGIFVGFIQALVFALLAATYIKLFVD